MESEFFAQEIVNKLVEMMGEDYEINTQFHLRSPKEQVRPDIFIQNPRTNTSLAIMIKTFSEEVELPIAVISSLIDYKQSLSNIGTDLLLVSTANISRRDLAYLEKSNIQIIHSTNPDEVVDFIVNSIQAEKPISRRKKERSIKYTNSFGKTYYLHGVLTSLKGGGERMMYFFASEPKEGVLDSVPEGYEVAETKSGLPVLKKAGDA